MNEFLYREVKRHLSLPLALVPFPGPSTFDLEFPVTIELAVVDGSLGAVAALVPGLEPFTSDGRLSARSKPSEGEVKVRSPMLTTPIVAKPVFS